METRSKLRALFDSLSKVPRTSPGPPLYSYRFSRANYEDVGAILRSYGGAALGNPYGSALFVMFAAEWFRRDRVGGAWDWIRPLAALGIRYDSQDPSSEVTYPEVRAAVERGLELWLRPLPEDRSWILAVVREAGFPAAATQLDPRLSTWLKRAVLAIERGFEPREAVGMESWRASERIVQALFDAAVSLCRAIVALRASLGPDQIARGDPVAALDAGNPDWRESLPFEVESRDVRALVEEVLRARPDRSSALSASRRLVREGEAWKARVSLGLSGEIEHRRMPAGLRERLDGLGRLRLVTRGELADSPRPFAALERDRTEERDCWEVRPLLAKFDRSLDLSADLRLGVLVGDRVEGEFVAAGGEAIADDVLVLEPLDADEPEACVELSLIGAGSARSRAPWLALAATQERLRQVEFETVPEHLGRLDDGERSLVAFRGRAQLRADGLRRVWVAGAADESKSRLVLAGECLRRVRDQVFLGLPRVWVEENGVFTAPPLAALVWRPRARGGEWRSLDRANPTGRVEIGWMQKREVVDTVSAAVAPAALELYGRSAPRGLRVGGLGARPLVARAQAPLPVHRIGDIAEVDLTGSPPGAPITLEIGCDAGPLVLELDDPAATAVLIDCGGRVAPRRARLAVSRLHGWRLLAARGGRMRFELARGGDVRGHFSRVVEGSAPLPAYADEIRSLLGSAQALDVEVWMSWLGASDRAAEVAWYGGESSGDGVRRRALALLRPQAGAVDTTDPDHPSTAASLREELGAGPWLVWSAAGESEVLRPRVLVDAGASPSDDVARAVMAATASERAAAFDRLFAAHDATALRHAIDTLVVARNEELPLSALDVASALCRNPVAAVRALALCDSLEERVAVLALQRDLSLLWCATPVSAWLEAFAERRDAIEQRLKAFDIERSEALRHVTAALAEISDLAPGIGAHVRLTWVFEVHSRLRADRPPLDPGHVGRLVRDVTNEPPREALRRLASDLLGRRLDVDAPPTGLGLAELAIDQAPFLADFNVAFQDVVAAPWVSARLAGELGLSDHDLRARCRRAWLYDPEYFESAMPLALAVIAGSPVSTSQETVR